MCAQWSARGRSCGSERAYSRGRPPVAPPAAHVPSALHPLTVHPVSGRPPGLPSLPSLGGTIEFEPLIAEVSTPVSPLTALVEESLASQLAVALVHDVHRPDAIEYANACDRVRQSSRDRSSVPSRQSSRPSSACRATSANPSGRARELSSDEVKSRQDNTLDWFRAAQCINSRARNAGEADSIVGKVHRWRSESRSRPASREPSLHKMITPRQGAHMPRSTDSTRASTPVANEMDDSAPSSTAASDRPAPRCLLDQFGCGVILKTESADTNRNPRVVKAASPVRKRNTMIEIKAGGNDLYERLAARRKTLQ